MWQINRIWVICLIVGIAIACRPGTSVLAAGEQEAPPAPELDLPVEGMVATGLSAPPVGVPTLTWQAVADATQYNVQVSTSAGFATTVVDRATTAASYTPETVLADGVYYWRVRTRRGNTWGSFSAPRSFTKDWCNSGALRPQLLAPEDDSRRIAFTNADFSWDPVPGAASYLLEISTDQSFSSVVYKATTIAPKHTPAKRLGNNTYFWRVTPLDHRDNHGASSDIWSFTFDWDVTPTLLAPDDGKETPFLPQFRWSAVEAAGLYQLEISTQPDFATTNKYVTSGTEFTPDRNLANDQDYYWRVKAIDAEGTNSPYSDARHFRMQWHLQPNLLTPLNNSIQNSFPFFSWTAVAGAEQYHLQISVDTSFGRPFADVKILNAPFYTQPHWPQVFFNQDYYWRVQGIDIENNVTPWSDVHSFQVSYTAPPNLIYPLDYSAPDAENMPVHEDRTVAWPLFIWDRAYSHNPEADNAIVIDEPAYYSLTVSTDGSFQSVNFAVETSGYAAAPTQANPFNGLQDGQIYFWRVRAFGADGHQIGTEQVWLARIDRGLIQPGVAQAPELYHPADGFEAVEAPPVLGWQPLQDADHYRVQISRNREFTQIVDEAAPSFANYVPWQGRRTPMPFGSYWWRVRAENAAGQVVGGWSAVYHFNLSLDLRFGNSYDFAPPSKPQSLLAAGGMYSASLTFVAASPVNGADPADLGALHVMLDRTYTPNYDWVFAFGVTPDVVETVQYAIFLDLDHQEGSGATADPFGRPLQVDPLYQPEFVAYINRSGNSVDGNDVRLFAWNGISWDYGPMLATVGGDAWYAEETHAIQLLVPYTAIGTSAEDFVGSLAVTVASLESDGALHDSVPLQPGDRIEAPAFVSDMLMPLYPFDTPASNPTVFYELPALHWHMPAYDSVDGYEVQVARDPRFTQLVETWESFESGTWPYYGLLPAAFHSTLSYADNESYFWRVHIRHEKNAANAYDYGPWSPPMRFKLSSRIPGHPTVSTGDEAATTPSFAWERVEGAAAYQLQIDDDANFSKPIFDVRLDDTSYTPLKPLPDGIYYWRVAIRRDYKTLGQWTPTMTFTKRSLTPEPLSPADADVVQTQPSFAWTPLITSTDTLHMAAPRYQLQVDSDPNFGKPSTFTTEAASYTLARGQSLVDGTWYWRVAMIDSSGKVGAYSPLQTFYKEYRPPILLSPTQGEKFTGALAFEWAPIAGAAYYKLQVADNDAFNSAVSVTTDGVRHTLTQQKPWNEFFWRVQMYDQDNRPGPYELGRVASQQYHLYLPRVEQAEQDH